MSIPRYLLAVSIVAAAAPASAQLAEPTSATFGVIGAYDLHAIDHAFLNRPLTLGAGQLELGVNLLGLRYHDEFSVFASTVDVTATAAMGTLALSYGVGISETQALEIGVSTPLDLMQRITVEVGGQSETESEDPEWGEGLGLMAALPLALGVENLDTALAVQVPLDLSSGGDTLEVIVVGAESRYKLDERMALFFGHGLLALESGVDRVIMPIGVGFAYQASDALALRVDTTPVTLGIKGPSTRHWGDAIDLGVSALLGVSEAADLRFMLYVPDVSEAGTLFYLAGGVAFRL